MKNLRVATVQFEHASGDPGANLERMRGVVEQATDAGVALLAFPECCVTGYWFLRRLSREALAFLAEPIPEGGTCQRLMEWARDRGMTIGAGLLECDAAGRLFNAYFVAMPDGTWACHRKLHTFVSEHLCSGNSYTVFDTPQGCRVGVLTCYDNNIHENARITALKGAEILLAPHQTGGCHSRSPHGMKPIDPRLWERRYADPDSLEAEFRGDKGRGWVMRWLPSRAHDNGMFLLFANGVGPDDNEIRTGGAMVLDPYGRVLNETLALGDDMVVVDLEASLRKACTGMRWMRARRPELYGPLIECTGLEQDIRSVRFGQSEAEQNGPNTAHFPPWPK